MPRGESDSHGLISSIELHDPKLAQRLLVAHLPPQPLDSFEFNIRQEIL